jgi:hypothetical protein
MEELITLGSLRWNAFPKIAYTVQQPVLEHGDPFLDNERWTAESD